MLTGSTFGRAMAAVFGVAAASFLLNFIAGLWEPARQFRFLGLMEYYRPAIIIRDGAFPVRDMAVLTAWGLICWIVGLQITQSRSVCTT
ncbi:MAG: hypothetical protein HRU76_10980 [Phycisphaeraceae bacterium]|nr:MAG: hypothetical protein HRU76_10980 [Phycisphaeraceae bacterium]